MPIDEAVLDRVPLGTVQTVNGPRARVVVVAVRREMVERVVGAVREAGLELEGLDLSAFGMVRAVDAPQSDRAALYVNAAGLVNVAVANASGCLFTRAAAGGIDSMAATLSERRGLTFEHARQWMKHVGFVEPLEQIEGDAELVAAARATLEDGVHQIADTVRNSLNFYRMQENAEVVDHVVLTGPAVEIAGLPERLSELLRMPVEAVTVGSADDVDDAARLTVAAGLAVAERAA
jgi:type IV pilus assembly protein PilM